MKTKTKIRPGRISLNHNTVFANAEAVLKTKTKIIRIAANHNAVVR